MKNIGVLILKNCNFFNGEKIAAGVSIMKRKYLTMEEKKQLALEGKDVPVVISSSSTKRNSFICKIRSIWDGDRKNKRMKI